MPTLFWDDVARVLGDPTMAEPGRQRPGEHTSTRVRSYDYSPYATMDPGEVTEPLLGPAGREMSEEEARRMYTILSDLLTYRRQ